MTHTRISYPLRKYLIAGEGRYKYKFKMLAVEKRTLFVYLSSLPICNNLSSFNLL